MAKLERVKGMITIKVQIKITLGKGRLVTGREGVQGELLGACPPPDYWPGWWSVIIH